MTKLRRNLAVAVVLILASHNSSSDQQSGADVEVISTFDRDGLTYEVAIRRGDSSDLEQESSEPHAVATDLGAASFEAASFDIADMLLRLRVSPNADPDASFDYLMHRDAPQFPNTEDPDDLFNQYLFERFRRARVDCASAVQSGRRSQIERYCLAEVGSIPKSIRDVVGVLAAYDRPVPFCGATIVGTQHIVTASHCFWSETGGELHSIDVLEGNKLYFIPLVERPLDGRIVRSVKVDETSLHGVTPYNGDTNRDFVVLELSQDIGSPFAEIVSPQQSPFPTYMLGPYPTTQIMMGNRRFKAIEYLQANAPDLCVAVYHDTQGCWYHSCQTVKTTSGSGLLVETGEGGAGLLAIHSGPSDGHSPCDGDQYGSELTSGQPQTNGRWPEIGFNVAADLPDTEVQRWLDQP